MPISYLHVPMLTSSLPSPLHLELQFYDCDEEAGVDDTAGMQPYASGINYNYAQYQQRDTFERNFLIPISLADVAAASSGMGGRTTRGGAGGMGGYGAPLSPLGILGVNNRPLSTPEKLRLLYADHGVLPGPGGMRMGHWPSSPGGKGHRTDGETSAKDLAVSIVETLFVLAEFSFWKVSGV